MDGAFEESFISEICKAGFKLSHFIALHRNSSDVKKLRLSKAIKNPALKSAATNYDELRGRCLFSYVGNNPYHVLIDRRPRILMKCDEMRHMKTSPGEIPN